jgi:hypothetical protein
MCQKRFRCPPDLHDRQVRCPYCKTVVKIPASSDAGRVAVEEMGDIIAREKAERDKQPVTARRRAVPRSMPVRSKNVAIVSVALVVVGLAAAVAVLVILLGRRDAADSAGGPGILKIGKRSPFGSEESGGPGAPAPPSKAGQPPPAPAPPSKPIPEAVAVKVERLLGGYKDQTVTYAAGRVTNNTGALIRVVKVIISIFDKDEKELGQATSFVLNLPPGATAPFVAEWQHEEGIIGSKWFPNYQLNPGGVPQELPTITSEDTVAIRDPNSMSTTGRVLFRATSQGALPVPTVMIQALLLGEGGKVVGAVRGMVDVNLQPKKTADVWIPWTQCAGHLVQGAEVWVQPAL